MLSRMLTACLLRTGFPSFNYLLGMVTIFEQGFQIKAQNRGTIVKRFSEREGNSPEADHRSGALSITNSNYWEYLRPSFVKYTSFGEGFPTKILYGRKG
jgi:hypothetical protein